MARARALFANGNYQECITHCEDILSGNSDSAPALKWAGKSLLALGKAEQAQRYLSRAHQLDQKDPEIVKDIGNCLLNNGKPEQAAHAYRKSLDIQADYAPAIYNLAGIAQIRGDYKSAAQLFVKAAELNGSLGQAWVGAAKCTLAMGHWDATIELCSKALSANRSPKGIYRIIGDAHKGKGDQSNALKAYEEEIRLSPEDPEPLINAANIMRSLNRIANAITFLEKALELRPENPIILSNLGCMLNESQRYEEAEKLCLCSAVLNPNNAELHGNLGIALFELGKINEALDATSRAVSLDPRNAGFLTNLGSIYVALGKHEEAIQYQQQALDLDPFDQDAHTGLSCIQLAKGEFAQGWDGYSYRKQKPVLQDMPIWNRTKKESVLVIGDQGIGDQILYASLIREAQTFCERLELRVDHRLIPLFERSFSGNITLDCFESHCRTTSCDSYIAMADLGRLFRRSVNDFSSENQGYLVADETRSHQIAEQIRGAACKKLVGLSWHSTGREYKNKCKSINIERIALSLREVDAELVCLQYGDHREEISRLRKTYGICIKTVDEIDLYNDIDGTAALVNACDAVVTISNATAHLAGALGKETHLLVPRSPNFYWGLEGEKTIWYPSLRLYRQLANGDWSKAIDEMARVLAASSK